MSASRGEADIADPRSSVLMTQSRHRREVLVFDLFTER